MIQSSASNQVLFSSSFCPEAWNSLIASRPSVSEPCFDPVRPVVQEDFSNIALSSFKFHQDLGKRNKRRLFSFLRKIYPSELCCLLKACCSPETCSQVIFGCEKIKKQVMKVNLFKEKCSREQKALQS